MRTKQGIIIATKMDKTIIIRVDMMKAHPKYKKRYRVSKKYYAHDADNAYKNKVGEEIVIYETRPLSKLKRWSVTPPPPKS